VANRTVGNLVIIDSAMGNNLALRSGTDDPQTSKFMVNAIAVWSADTTGAVLLTAASTTQDILFRYNWVGLTSDSMGKVLHSNPSWFSFGQAQPFDNIKAPVVTGGTAFLYFV